MRRSSLRVLVPAALLAAAALTACGDEGGDTAAPRQAPATSDAPTRPADRATTTSTEPDVVAAAPEAEAPTAEPAPAPPAAEPAGATCDEIAVHDAIAGSDAVAPGLAFDVTYLACADGYGWAQLTSGNGDGATAVFQGTGGDISLLDLGSAVCPTAAGVPAAIATELAPAGSTWQQECNS